MVSPLDFMSWKFMKHLRNKIEGVSQHLVNFRVKRLNRDNVKSRLF